MAETVAIVSAIAAVAGATTSIASSLDSARRAKNAAADANAYNQTLIQQEQARAERARQQSNINRQKMLGSIRAQASKSGFTITDASSPAYLLNEVNTEFDKDVEAITMDSLNRITARNFAMGDIASQADARKSLAYSGAFSSLAQGASGVANSGVWKIQ